jgi:excisionase family DNA binding protein
LALDVPPRASTKVRVTAAALSNDHPRVIETPLRRGRDTATERPRQEFASFSPVPAQASPMLTASEVANLLHLHVNTVKRLGDRGELPFFRVCKRGDRRYRFEDVMEFLARNR